ncbi:MAG TPA: hypothetical protein VJH87_19670, partial [Vicinamibacteria bacterium]|nr:hypothetical protein [Vicinamibacteria bacterium]
MVDPFELDDSLAKLVSQLDLLLGITREPSHELVENVIARDKLTEAAFFQGSSELDRGFVVLVIRFFESDRRARVNKEAARHLLGPIVLDGTLGATGVDGI